MEELSFITIMAFRIKYFKQRKRIKNISNILISLLIIIWTVNRKLLVQTSFICIIHLEIQKMKINNFWVSYLQVTLLKKKITDLTKWFGFCNKFEWWHLGEFWLLAILKSMKNDLSLEDKIISQLQNFCSKNKDHLLMSNSHPIHKYKISLNTARPVSIHHLTKYFHLPTILLFHSQVQAIYFHIFFQDQLAT